jgi:GNAT superfamily N-acetyltransferase
MSKSSSPITIVPVLAPEILNLRRDVLYPGKDISVARYYGDDDLQSQHFAARINNDQIIAGVSFIHAPYGTEHKLTTIQLRGMAVYEEFRGAGYGELLLLHGENQVLQKAQNSGIQALLLWCDAREKAVGFYQKNGWFVANPTPYLKGENFHLKMTKILT